MLNYFITKLANEKKQQISIEVPILHLYKRLPQTHQKVTY